VVNVHKWLAMAIKINLSTLKVDIIFGDKKGK